MSNHHKNLRELFSSQFLKQTNIPNEKCKLNKSPQSVRNNNLNIQQKNGDSKSIRINSPVSSPHKVKVIQVNMNKYVQSSQNPHTSVQSKESSRSRSRSPLIVSIQQTLKKLNIDQKKNMFFDFEDSLSKSNHNTPKQNLHPKFLSINNKSPMVDIPELRIPKPCSSTKIRPEIQNFEMIVNSLLQKYDSIQQQSRVPIKKISKEIPEDEELIQETQICVSKLSFKFHYIIGKGGFGRVWKVELRKNKTPYAMKEMSKAKVIAKRSVNSVMNERNLLAQIGHPFIINMNYSFQDRENLYLVMDLLTGGDLRYHIGIARRFPEYQAKFFIGCVVLALEYLHGQNIIHRDVKPENIVLDENGYARLTDLGIARIWKPENSQDTSGTPGYMAPEVMCRQNHTIAVDYFALGVMTYEFMLGRRPYNGRSRQEIRDQILTRQVLVRKNEIPDDWSLESGDFINKLIQRKPNNRLGNNGPEEVKQHPWFSDFPWKKLINKEILSPFIPSPIQDNSEYLNNISDDNDTLNELIVQNRLQLKKNSVQNLFVGYSYDSSQNKPLKITKSTNST